MNIRNKQVAVIIGNTPKDVTISILMEGGQCSVKAEFASGKKKSLLTLNTEEVDKKLVLIPQKIEGFKQEHDRDGAYWNRDGYTGFDWSNGLDRGVLKYYGVSQKVIKLDEVQEFKLALEAVKVAIKGETKANALQQIVANTEKLMPSTGKSK